jgi:hypothetical protein
LKDWWNARRGRIVKPEGPGPGTGTVDIATESP